MCSDSTDEDVAGRQADSQAGPKPPKPQAKPSPKCPKITTSREPPSRKQAKPQRPQSHNESGTDKPSQVEPPVPQRQASRATTSPQSP